MTSSPSSRYSKNLREHIATLRERGKLTEVTRAIDKDTGLHPLVRLQYRGLAEAQRKAFLFTNVTDQSGRKYDIPVAVACMAGTREIYAIGMGCEPSEIAAKWVAAQDKPIPPRRVERGPVQEVVLTGEALKAAGGLAMLPIPISTPGFDSAPYTTSSHFVSRDPETGTYNVGNYRGQLKAPDRIGCFPASRGQHLRIHWEKYRARGEAMPAAIVIGVPPAVSYTAVGKLPEGLEEYGVAGAIAGEPLELVRCVTNDLEVPAEAEIVIEGIIPTDVLEPEGPFGEFPGYMAKTEVTLFMNVTAITHRKNPIYQAFLSQFPPSESSMIRGVAHEYIILKFLTIDRGYKNVLDVACHESTGSWGLTVIQVSKPEPGQAVAMLDAVSKNEMGRSGKMIVVVDDDIDPRDADSVNWALSYRMQPARDTRVVTVPEMLLDPSLADPADASARDPLATHESRASMLLIDATRKWPYPPTSLPAKPFMEQALTMWQELGLPKLTLKAPWYGYDLGYWPDKNVEMAERAVQGRYFDNGEENARNRHKL